MNKDEILAKSRQENKGRTDERELAVIAGGGKAAYFTGMAVCIAILLINSALRIFGSPNYNPALTFAVWGVWFSMQGVMFLYKYIKIGKKHEIVISIVYLVLASAMLTMMMLILFGVM